MTSPSLADSFGAACARHGPAVALDGDGLVLTYEALWSRAEATATRLRKAGLGRGDPVMVRCSNHPTDFVGFFAAWLCGAVVAPVHRTAPPDVVAAIQAKARCRASLDLLADRVDGPIVQRLDDEPVDEERRVLLDTGALVIFTSGSTGLPKGAVLSHASVDGKLRQNQALFRLDARTSTLLVLSDTFSFGIWVALLTLREGGRVVMMPKFTPAMFLEQLVSARITFAGVVPTMIRATFGTLPASDRAQAGRRIARAACLRTVVIGGEPLGAQLSADLRLFLDPAKLYDVYGLTETTTSDFVLDPADYPARGASIGRPFPGIRFRVVGDDGAERPPGIAGELQLHTPYIMSGYLGDGTLSRAAFDDGWFRTGDLATFDDDGYVTITGRSKELIMRGGNKITPLEVERALLRCAGVGGALVTGMPDPILGQRIHALLVPRAGETLALDVLLDELASRLERYKFPDVFHLDSQLPTGRTGKIDRQQLQQRIDSGVLPPMDEPPRRG